MYTHLAKEMKILPTLVRTEVVNFQVINSVILRKSRLNGIIGIGKNMVEKNLRTHIMQEFHKSRTQLMAQKIYSSDDPLK